jgi:hypothetical protein
VPLTQNEYDALVSFTYNAGGGNLAKSTLLRKLNAGDYDGAAAEFDKWVSSKGQRLNGLIRRRNAEEALFRSIKVGIPAGGGAVVAGKGADEAGYSTGAQIAIGVGIFLVVAVIVVLILRRRS